ncbi:MAG TPA: glycosyltransferase family 2 protein [Tepidisphaeraceae bacterium]
MSRQLVSRTSDAREHGSEPEISVVLPCLNEADTLGRCIQKAYRAFALNDIHGEVVVADNGSTDDSVKIAHQAGARVVHVEERGYGSALQAGIEAARGKFILMADADDSYDLLATPEFLAKLRDGYELVQGCRLPRGGGTINDGAMPLLHRYAGNPTLSAIARWWFKTPVTDIYCGMRGFTRELYDRLGLRCTGMEFATEMIIKASRYAARFAEVPITLHRDGRVSHPPHLNTWRDGWRTLRFFLMVSPRWLFLEPGRVLVALGLVLYGLALPGLRVRGIHFSSHTLVIGTLMLLCGYQAVLFAIGVKALAMMQGVMPRDRRIDRILEKVTIERGIVAGAVTMALGMVLLVAAVVRWRETHFGDLDYESTMRLVIPGAALVAIGFQTVLAGFLFGILSFFRK